MPKPSSDPSRVFIRARIPVEVAVKARKIARLLGQPVHMTYTFVLTRALWDAEVLPYARDLANELGLPLTLKLVERRKRK